MARTGRPKAVLELTVDECEQLQRWARRRTSAQALAMRSRIVLACAQGRSNTAVADELGVSVQMVGKWRARFVEARLDGLADDPRPGRPASITGEQVEDIVLATLESTPANATHWSRAKMAERTGLSKSSIGRIWKAFDLRPHRADTFKLSTDPLFVEKVFDVVGLYLNPPEGAVVLSVDEKPQVQALVRSQPAFPMTRADSHRDLGQRGVEDADVVGGGVRPRVARTELGGEELAGVVQVGQQRVVAEGVLERRRGLFLLGVADQGPYPRIVDTGWSITRQAAG